MRKLFPYLFVVGLLIGVPAVAHAQEAAVSGTITDSTGGVLPGVTVTAVHEASGNTFVGVTDDRGMFRLPVRTGLHRLTLELAGFGTVNRSIDLLVNQQAVVNLQMAPSTLQETVTVTGEAPLIDTTKSEVGGNIDPRQLQDLPVNGRNWLDLATLAPGSRQNSSSDTLGGRDYQFQINIDGQQVTQLFSGAFGQPRYSREAIAEFQFISNRFDASQGHSSGQQLNAITKSGTNAPQGTFSGYFRDATFNAKDFIQDRVLPYSNQQLAWTYGGPIKKDRIHFFGTFEYEREPTTFSYSSPYPMFNFDQLSTRTEKKASLRLDFQFSPRTRLSLRGNKAINHLPIDNRFSGGATRHPSSGIETGRATNNILATVTQVLSSRVVNEVRGGDAAFSFYQHPVVKWPGHPYAPFRTLGGTPILTFRGGYTIGQGHANSPVNAIQDPYSLRDDLSFSFNRGGRHDVKVGGEYIYNKQSVTVCDFCMGTYDMQGGNVPANIESLFPVWNDVSTWNLAALSPITRSYRLGVGQFIVYPVRHELAGWIQDDWAASARLTLNLGLRYDLGKGSLEDIVYKPFVPAGPGADKNNFGPRAGFAYRLNDKTVVRGGVGKYFANEDENTVFWSMLTQGTISVQQLYDGRPDFAARPFNGPIPTYDQAVDMFTRGLIRRSARELPDPHLETAHSYQSSMGVQRQFGSSMSLEADWVYTGNRKPRIVTDVNLAYNLATGSNYPFTDVAKRPTAGWDSVNLDMAAGKDRYHGLQLAWNKRMSRRWQASATYLLAYQYQWQHVEPPPGCSSVWTISSGGQFQCNVPIQLNAVYRDEWYLADDANSAFGQRNRATFNGIWDIGYGFQLSGLYFFGDNGWQTPTSGLDLLGTGSTNNVGSANTSRVRAINPDGSLQLVERRSFNRPSLHRVDTRLQKRVKFGNRTTVDGMLEVFNLFNHKNYNSFVTNLSNVRYGQPSQDTNIAFQPRMLQLGFRVSF
jgi:hypothetical protein